MSVVTELMRVMFAVMLGLLAVEVAVALMGVNGYVILAFPPAAASAYAVSIKREWFQ